MKHRVDAAPVSSPQGRWSFGAALLGAWRESRRRQVAREIEQRSWAGMPKQADAWTPIARVYVSQ
jgi:hypothetical protein